MEGSKNHLLSERIIRILKMDGSYFLPSTKDKEYLAIFDITNN